MNYVDFIVYTMLYIIIHIIVKKFRVMTLFFTQETSFLHINYAYITVHTMVHAIIYIIVKKFQMLTLHNVTCKLSRF